MALDLRAEKEGFALLPRRVGVHGREPGQLRRVIEGHEGVDGPASALVGADDLDLSGDVLVHLTQKAQLDLSVGLVNDGIASSVVSSAARAGTLPALRIEAPGVALVILGVGAVDATQGEDSMTPVASGEDPVVDSVRDSGLHVGEAIRFPDIPGLLSGHE